MSRHFTRRHFLRSGVLLGAGLSVKLPYSSSAHEHEHGDSPEGTGIMVAGAIYGIHDPVIIKEADTYYVYCTGNGIPIRTSTDLINWQRPFPTTVFANMPDWAREKIPGQNDFWAPDISFYNGKYHLYYSVSTFGKNRSVIGLATNQTLDSKSPDFKWIDQGLVIESQPSDNYNCIDPNLVIDGDGGAWLVFGSFWSGIKMRRLDAATGKLSEEDTTLYALAQRTVNSGAVEGPFLIQRGDYYYLFVSFDFCCRGVESTYHVVVGRSKMVTGPYVDRDGVEMLRGGGTQVTFPTDRWKGPGHNSILRDGDSDYIVYHAYDAEGAGTPTLHIRKLLWDADGWVAIDPDDPDGISTSHP